MGDIAFANAVAVPLGVLLDAGLVQLLLREYRVPVGGGPEGLPQQFRLMIRQRYVLIVAYVGVVSCVTGVFGSTPDRWWLGLLIGLSYAAESVSQVWLTPARARLNMRPDLVLRLSQGAGILSLTGAAFAIFGSEAWLAAAVYSLVFVLSALGSARIWFGAPRWSSEPSVAGDDHASRGERRAFGVVAILTTVYSRMDAIVVQLIAGSAALAAYTVAFKLVEAARILPGAIARSLLARTSRSGLTDLSSWPREIAVSAAAGLVLGAGLVSLGPVALELLFGGTYADAAASAIQLLGLTTFGIGFTAPVTAFLLGGGKASVVRVWTTLTLVATASSIVPLTLAYGITGTAAAVLIGEVVSVVGFAGWALVRFRPQPRLLPYHAIAGALLLVVVTIAMTGEQRDAARVLASSVALALLIPALYFAVFRAQPIPSSDTE